MRAWISYHFFKLGKDFKAIFFFEHSRKDHILHLCHNPGLQKGLGPESAKNICWDLSCTHVPLCVLLLWEWPPHWSEFSSKHDTEAKDKQWKHTEGRISCDTEGCLVACQYSDLNPGNFFFFLQEFSLFIQTQSAWIGHEWLSLYQQKWSFHLLKPLVINEPDWSSYTCFKLGPHG